jgi:hypothetical protein
MKFPSINDAKSHLSNFIGLAVSKQKTHSTSFLNFLAAAATAAKSRMEKPQINERAEP